MCKPDRFAVRRRDPLDTCLAVQMSEIKKRIVIHERQRLPGGGPTCIDLFSGAGGLAVGFRAAGFAVLAATDRDADAADTFRRNFPETTFFRGEIAALTAPALLKACSLEKGDLDCLIGGPPCQSFSYNNHQRSSEDERAQLFKDYIRLVKGLRPKILIMENVPGILTIGENIVIKEILRRLVRLGYLVDVKTLSSEEFGTPQIRRRVFIVASRVGQALEIWPEPTHRAATSARSFAGGSRAAKKSKQKLRKAVTVWQAIGDLSEISIGDGAHASFLRRRKPTSDFQRSVHFGYSLVHNHVCHALSSRMLERIRHVPEGGNWRNIPFDLLPAGMQRAKAKDHTKRYGRLARNGLASTVLTKCDPHWGAYVHPLHDRTISVREAARLQGFPDSFVFAGTKVSKHYEQVGNAVPIPVAKALGKKAAAQLVAARKIACRSRQSRSAKPYARPKIAAAQRRTA